MTLQAIGQHFGLRIAAASVAALTCGLANAAKLPPDTTVMQVSRVTIVPSANQLKAMPEPLRAMQERGIVQRIVQISTFVKGGKMQIDISPDTYLVNASSDVVTVVETGIHQYFAEYRRDLAGKGLSGTPFAANFTRGTETKMIFGHLCVDYKVNARVDGGAMYGDIWAASDLPNTLFPAATQSFTPCCVKNWQRVHGMPLKVDITISGPGKGAMILTTVTRSVSVSPLATDVFAVPASFAKTVDPDK